MSTDNVYWTFSAAAQSISAFVAFLLTGYAIVQTMMESMSEKDETLQEIHAKLLKYYHGQLKLLVWLTGISIIISLLIVYFNPVSIWLVVFAGILNVMAIVSGVLFVIEIVDPDKYEKLAIKELKISKKDVIESEKDSRNYFIGMFIDLEKMMRDYIKKRRLNIPENIKARIGWVSFRDMIVILQKNEIISLRIYEELREINEKRNLIIHGNADIVDRELIDKLIKAKSHLSVLLKARKSKVRIVKIPTVI